MGKKENLLNRHQEDSFPGQSPSSTQGQSWAVSRAGCWSLQGCWRNSLQGRA